MQRVAPRVGIIGTGWGVNVQVPAFRAAGWTVTALCGRTEKARKIGEELGIPFTTADPFGLIQRSDVDLVTIVLPPHTHKDLSLAALEAGKHVLCDKPTALNATEAQEMLHKAKARPKQLSLLDFELRSLSSFKAAHDIVHSGKLGKVFHVRAEFFSKLQVTQTHHWWWEREKGGGLLGAVGTHMLDYISWILGEKAVSVNALFRTIVKERQEEGSATKRAVTADDSNNLRLRYSAGTEVDLTMNMYGAGPSEKKIKEFVFSGEEGTLYLDFNRTQCGLEVYNLSNALITKIESELPPEKVPRHAFGNGTYVLAQEVKALLEKEVDMTAIPAHMATFADGLNVQQIIDAAWESHAQGGTWVDIKH